MKIPKKDRVKEIIRLFSYGYKVKDIAKLLEVSKSTIYRDYQDFRINSSFVISDILYRVDKNNIKNSLEKLSYSDIVVLAKRFNCGAWIQNKKRKIEKLIPFLSQFFYFDLNPINFNRDDIKRAYFKKAKELHPDMTKIDTNKEFSDMNKIYNILLKTINLMNVR